jgi:predicted nucleotidyltransferase
MEDIKDRLGDKKYYFLKKLEDYIGEELIFFGSIKRCDFFEENSDIDIAIITDNTNSTIKKLQGYLNIGDDKMRKIVQKIPNSDRIIYGYKTNYENESQQLSIEIILYDEKYRNDILEHINRINNFPYYITYPLIFLKLLFYKLNIISSDILKYFKVLLINTYLQQPLKDNLIPFNFKP